MLNIHVVLDTISYTKTYRVGHFWDTLTEGWVKHHVIEEEKVNGAILLAGQNRCSN
ncbi:hypothetical protein LGK95_02535 [Clostridium algoriphilum]|uniref:hypothetical protein n=1 Tax=Clostridium algoriphilum TaxID=198347 RepID=UPI001CF2B077|nr:hypothetical protein [Clostridium algoriphilum]MCB2292416.1 hypothetical protein [Clostridium algoriphilum]